MKIKGKITMLFREDGLRIELRDSDASVLFAEITVGPKETLQAMSRLAFTPCEIEVRNLDVVGKKMEHKTLEFEVGDDKGVSMEDREKLAAQRANEACPEGWESDNYFRSQNSFWTADGKLMARTTIRRYV